MQTIGPLQPWAIRIVVLDENVSRDRLGVEPADGKRRTGDGRDRVPEKTERSRRRIRRRAISNRDIRAVRPQIHHFVARRYSHVDIRVALLEAAETGHDPKSRDAGARSNG